MTVNTKNLQHKIKILSIWVAGLFILFLLIGILSPQTPPDKTQAKPPPAAKKVVKTRTVKAPAPPVKPPPVPAVTQSTPPASKSDSNAASDSAGSPDAVPGIGDIAHLSPVSGDFVVYVARTGEIEHALISAAVANDQVGMDRIVNGEGVFMVSSGTKARVLADYNAWDQTSRIRIIGGPFDGTSGWVPNMCLKNK